MLRVRLLAWRKNNLIIDDFRVQDFVLMSSFCTNVSDSKMLTYPIGVIGTIGIIGAIGW